MLGLQLQQLQERARPDLAHLVDDDDVVAGQLDPARRHRAQERIDGDGVPDVGILQGVGLLPARRQADHLAASRAEGRIGLIGGDQWLQQGGFARSRGAGQHRQLAVHAERVDRRLLRRRVLWFPLEVETGRVDRGRECRL